MAIFPVYTDVADFLANASAAIETNSLVGGNATLHAATAAGSTSLVVDPVSSAYPVSGFSTGQAWIFDGMQSEIVTITNVNTGTATLTLATGTQVAHDAGVNISSAGTSGCLARAIVDAGRKAEAYCRQGPPASSGIPGSAATALSVAVAAGATSGTVVAGAGLAAGAALILDGAQSERVTISAVAGNTVTFASGCAYAHGSGATVTGVTNGDRFLYALPRVETYRLATMTAFIDSDTTLTLMPYHFPVASVTSMALQLGTLTGNAVSLSALTLPDEGRLIMVPYVSWANGNPQNQWIPNPLLRDPNIWLTLSYTAGPIALANSSVAQLLVVPDDIKRAVYYLTMSTLAYRSNPLGAASVRQGDTQRQYELRGNQKQQSNLLIKEASDALDPYRRT